MTVTETERLVKKLGMQRVLWELLGLTAETINSIGDMDRGDYLLQLERNLIKTYDDYRRRNKEI